MDYRVSDFLIEIPSKNYKKRLNTIATIAIKKIKKRPEGEK